MAVTMHQGNMPHIFWIDIANDGMFTECAVMKKDGLGNVFFFPLSALDKIDKGRLAKIVSNRNAEAFELWDLMSQITLNNGVNALEYFHQLVEVLSPTGKRTKPREGVIGTAYTGVVDMRGSDERARMQEQANMAATAAASAAAAAATAAVTQGATPAPAAAPAAMVAEAEEPAAPRRTRKKKAATPSE